MNNCYICKNLPATLSCPCGKYVYCTADCMSKHDEHLKTCNPYELDYSAYISIMWTFQPIIHAVKEDLELHEAAKNFLKLLIEKLNKVKI